MFGSNNMSWSNKTPTFLTVELGPKLMQSKVDVSGIWLNNVSLTCYGPTAMTSALSEFTSNR